LIISLEIVQYLLRHHPGKISSRFFARSQKCQYSSNDTFLTMIAIRTAKPSDIAQLVELLKELFTIEADFNFDRDKQACGLNLLLKSEKDCILVAEQLSNNRVLGMCSVQTMISTAEGGTVGLLEDLIVAADFRHQGIASKLVAEAVNWAESQCLRRLQLLADKNNLPALHFYQKQGWQSTQLVCLRKRR
jgi:ribosomal protein S18 acetylase RimI-like enzyme